MSPLQPLPVRAWDEEALGILKIACRVPEVELVF
jgi:hypothetical protein